MFSLGPKTFWEISLPLLEHTAALGCDIKFTLKERRTVPPTAGVNPQEFGPVS